MHVNTFGYDQFFMWKQNDGEKKIMKKWRQTESNDLVDPCDGLTAVMASQSS